MKPKKFLSSVLSRNAAIIILLLAQIAVLLLSVAALGEKFYIVYAFLIVLDIVLIVIIMNKKEPASYRLSWIIIISVVPLLGGVSYIFVKATQRQSKLIDQVYQKLTREVLLQDKQVLDELKTAAPDSLNLARYISAHGLYPVYRNYSTSYFPLGEMQFQAMLDEMEKAEKFIFLEFFIISEGYMFDRVSELLLRKAAQGVDIRLMYDGIGTGMLGSSKIFRRLENGGVKCRVFNPFRPMLSSVQNNRDHRKIIIIDGHTAFNGGTNLADEYINRKVRFGHWKDTAIMTKGPAVRNYTHMFIQLWYSDNKISDYKLAQQVTLPEIFLPGDGFIQPFSDSPLDDEPVGKNVYQELINNARRYVYITTPYLILDEEMLNTLTFAAKKGVDVRLIVPHIPDKWYVHVIAWINYSKLISAGVKIYEYTPGFIHAKSCVADGETAVVGTINFDFRSFYLHFESAAVLYGCSVIGEIERDFLETAEMSHLVTAKECRDRPLRLKIAGSILNMFAPLL